MPRTKKTTYKMTVPEVVEEPINLRKAALVSLLKGLGVAAVGVGLTYLQQWVVKVDFGVYAPVAGMVNSVLFNFIRKLPLFL